MNITLNNNRQIGTNNQPYFIAEVNTSHFGNLEKAKELIRLAKESGCDCVKFQSWSEDTLYSNDFYQENPIAKRFIKKFSLSPDQLHELSIYARSIEIDFASTPYSIEEVDFLIDKCGVPFIKVASMDINNYPLLKHIANRGTAIILSTGMSDYEEIQDAVNLLKSNNAQNIALLHCISIYPTPLDIVNLKNLSLLQNTFPNTTIGYSDHTLDIEISLAAVALGATIIEKHFTLDKSLIGMDNQMAIEYNQLTELIAKSKNIYNALGSKEKILSQDELNQRSKMRRSLVAKINLNPGDILTTDNLDAKRPGTGISVANLNQYLGKKVINPIFANSLINPNDISS